jgi:hypothetical protein
MRRANQPLDPVAVKKANQSLMAETGGRPLTTGPEDAALRAKWMDAYIEAAGPDSYTSTKKDRKKPLEQVHPCAKKVNFVELQYLYCDGVGVAGASYEVKDLDTNGIVASGTLDNEGYAYSNLPLSTNRIKYYFYNDPKPVKIDLKPIKNEEKAKVSTGWLDRMTDSVVAAGDWTWGAVQGDYNEDPTMGQIALNTALTLIPFVDQAGDVRDITANLKYLVIDERYNEKGVWFGLVITVVGCIPEAGSLAKGVFKVIFKKIKEGAKVPVEELFEVFNHFAGRGDAKKFLKELSSKLSDYGKFAKDKIKEILNTLITWLDNAKTFVTSEVAIKLEKLKQSCQKVLSAVDKMVNEVIDDIKQKLDETINKHVDLGQEGNPKTLNTRKRTENSVIGVKTSEKIIENIRGTSKNDFLNTVKDFENGQNKEIGDKAWELWKNEDWSELEKLFNKGVDGKPINGGWPPNNGFVSTKVVTLPKGSTFDRYGGKIVNEKFVDNGRFTAANAGEPFKNRALPESYKSNILTTYEVNTPIEVIQGEAIPWFGQNGGGVQNMNPQSINVLEDFGLIQIK